MISPLKSAILAACLLSLSACVNFTPMQGSALNQHLSWPQRLKRLQTIHHWHLQGAIAFSQGQRNASANLIWQQQDNKHYRLNLFGPFGTGNLIIRRKGGPITLQQAGKKTLTATTPELLIYQATGWQLPVSSLRYWILGRPDPNYLELGGLTVNNHYQTLDQLGWRIHYLRYSQINGIDLPTKLLLESGDVRVKIVVNNWQT